MFAFLHILGFWLCPDSQLEGMPAGAMVIDKRFAACQQFFKQADGIVRGGVQIADDFLQKGLLRLVGVVGPPAVIIGNQGQQGIAHLGFAGEFGLGQSSHSNQVGPPLAVHLRFRTGGKLRPFHADVGT